MNHLRKKINKFLLIIFAAQFLLTFSACFHNVPTIPKEAEEGQRQKENDRLQIAVSIHPQKYFVENIGAENVNVTVMVEKGANPATYEPKPEQMKAIEQADAYISIGVPFENVWIEKFKGVNPDLQFFDQGEGIPKLTAPAHYHETPEQQRTDQDTEDPHIWLSPKKAKKQAENITDALIIIDPDRTEYYRQQYQKLSRELDEVDFKVNATLTNVTHKEFLIFHPSLGYFASDYGLTQIPIEIEGKEPSPKEIAEIVTTAKEKNLKTIFVQEQFSQTTAQTLAAEIGGVVVPFDPLAENWKENMLHIADLFVQNN